MHLFFEVFHPIDGLQDNLARAPECGYHTKPGTIGLPLGKVRQFYVRKAGETLAFVPENAFPVCAPSPSAKPHSLRALALCFLSLTTRAFETLCPFFKY